jgi:hypothetical protein
MVELSYNVVVLSLFNRLAQISDIEVLWDASSFTGLSRNGEVI